MTTEQAFAEFLAESNRIEGYDFPPKDYLQCANTGIARDIHIDNSVAAWSLMQEMAHDPLTEAGILLLHKYQTSGLLLDQECGHFRQIQVFVGNHVPPHYSFVPNLIGNFVLDFNIMSRDPLDMHCFFEDIHPFVDGNGRVGRLLWAWDLIRRNIPVEPFLNQFPGPHFLVKRGLYYEYLEDWRA